MAQRTFPSELLRDVPHLLRKQWEAFVASGATVLRWQLADDEWDWVESFLEGRMDGVSKCFVIEHPADTMQGYGFAAARPLLDALSRTRIPRRGAWPCPSLASGMRDTDVVAMLLQSLALHARGSWLAHVCVVLAPARIADERAWLAWVEMLAGTLASATPKVRIVLLDDAKRPRYASLDRYSGAVVALAPSLGIGERITQMASRAADTESVEGQLRVLAVRAMQCVSDGRIDVAERIATALESLAHDTGRHAHVVPVRFAVAGAHIAAGRHLDAVTSYRAAETAAEAAEALGDSQGLWLRIMARFGVGCGLLAAPRGADRAGRYLAETAPLCRTLGDGRLELEAFRCAAVAFEIAQDARAAWDMSIKALAVVDGLGAVEREGAMLVPLADAMLRLTQSGSMSSYRRAVENELRKRGMRGTQWA